MEMDVTVHKHLQMLQPDFYHNKILKLIPRSNKYINMLDIYTLIVQMSYI